jgi:GAF domain-containing protein
VVAVEHREFDLSAAMADAARTMYTTSSLEQGLQMIAEAAAKSIPGFRHAGISLLTPGGKEETKAATDELVWQLDTLQYDLHEGPCVDAMHGPRVVIAPRIRQQQRWPSYVPEAVKLGLRAQMAVKLYLDHHGTLGGLNLYSTDCEEVEEEAEHMAELFAAHAAVALGSIRQLSQLNEALHSRKVIGMALGIVMQRYGIDEDQAFKFLLRMSSHGGSKLREVAQGLVDEANRNSSRALDSRDCRG